MLSSFAAVGVSGRITLWRDFDSSYQLPELREFCNVVLRRGVPDDIPPVSRWKDIALVVRPADEVYLIATTSLNANAALLLEMLRAIEQVIRTFISKERLTADVLASKSTLLYGLLDEMIEHGQPQIMDVNLLQRFLSDAHLLQGNERSIKQKLPSLADPRHAPPASPTADITGSVSWRPPDIHYRTNEAFLDVVETVNALFGPTGEVLSADVLGSITMDSKLSGMPVCRLGLNDRLSVQRQGGVNRDMVEAQLADQSAAADQSQWVQLEGISLHPCVRLAEFDVKREVCFTPPDGRFKLMSYRTTEHLQLPFRLTTSCKQLGRTRVQVGCVLQPLYSSGAPKVKLQLPLPASAAKVEVSQRGGRARVDNAQHVVRYKVKKCEPGQQYSVTADISMISTIGDRGWAKPPVSLSFDLPGLTASGLKVRFFNVSDAKGGYKADKWVRSSCVAGTYEARLP